VSDCIYQHRKRLIQNNSIFAADRRKFKSRPGVVGYKPGFCTNLNLWAGVTSSSATPPAIFSQTLNSHGFISIIEGFLCPFVDDHEDCYVIQDK